MNPSYTSSQNIENQSQKDDKLSTGKTEILEISQKSRVTKQRSGSFSKRIHKNCISRINCNPRSSEENKNIVGKRSCSESRKEERKFFHQIRSNKQTTEDYMRESSELSYIYRDVLDHISIFETNEEDSYVVEKSAHCYIKKSIILKSFGFRKGNEHYKFIFTITKNNKLVLEVFLEYFDIYFIEYIEKLLKFANHIYFIGICEIDLKNFKQIWSKLCKFIKTTAFTTNVKSIVFISSKSKLCQQEF